MNSEEERKEGSEEVRKEGRKDEFQMTMARTDSQDDQNCDSPAKTEQSQVGAQ